MEFTTFVEKGRIKYEQPLSDTGFPVFPQQYWRDAKLIPKTCPTFAQMINMGDGQRYNSVPYYDGQTHYTLIEVFDKLILKRLEGTNNSYTHEKLKDIILPVFDTTLNSYEFFIFIDDGQTIKPISYGVGNPRINSMAGVITFEDLNFADRVKDFTIRMSFTRYAGRKGTFGDSTCFDLPIRDDLTLLKSAQDNTETASFEVKAGTKKHGRYILPPLDKGYYQNDSMAKNVLMTQENMNDIIHKIGVIDGGLYEKDETDLTLKNGKFLLRKDI